MLFLRRKDRYCNSEKQYVWGRKDRRKGFSNVQKIYHLVFQLFIYFIIILYLYLYISLYINITSSKIKSSIKLKLKCSNYNQLSYI